MPLPWPDGQHSCGGETNPRPWSARVGRQPGGGLDLVLSSVTYTLAANVDNCITIPMRGTRSLNLATAVAIVLFEAVRQQRGGVEAAR